MLKLDKRRIPVLINGHEQSLTAGMMDKFPVNTSSETAALIETIMHLEVGLPIYSASGKMPFSN